MPYDEQEREILPFLSSHFISSIHIGSVVIVPSFHTDDPRSISLDTSQKGSVVIVSVHHSNDPRSIPPDTNQRLERVGGYSSVSPYK